MQILINESGTRWLVLGHRGALQAATVWASPLSRLDALPPWMAIAPMLVAIVLLNLSVFVDARAAPSVLLLRLFLVGGSSLLCRVSFKARRNQEIGRITRVESASWAVRAHVWLCLLLLSSCFVVIGYGVTRLPSASMLEQSLLFAGLVVAGLLLLRSRLPKRDA